LYLGHIILGCLTLHNKNVVDLSKIRIMENFARWKALEV
jgi:hypothetical protein